MGRGPKMRSDLAVYELDDELVVYDPSTAGVHHLNPFGAMVFRLSDGTATIKQTAAELAEAYGVASDELDPQVRAVVKELRRHSLLERARAASSNSTTTANEAGDERKRIRLDVPRST